MKFKVTFEIDDSIIKEAEDNNYFAFHKTTPKEQINEYLECLLYENSGIKHSPLLIEEIKSDEI